jgi:hypothetical protein
MISLMDKYVDNAVLLQRVLFAIGALGRSNEDNAQTLSQLNVLEMLNDFFVAAKDYNEDNVVVYGLFAAIAGLCETYTESS